MERETTKDFSPFNLFFSFCFSFGEIGISVRKSDNAYLITKSPLDRNPKPPSVPPAQTLPSCLSRNNSTGWQMYFQTVLRYRFDLSAFGHPFPVPFPSLPLFRADDEQRVEWRGEREREGYFRPNVIIGEGRESQRGKKQGEGFTNVSKTL